MASSVAATSARPTSTAARLRDILDVVACADLDMSRAQARAAEYGVRACTSVEELLANPEHRDRRQPDHAQGAHAGQPHGHRGRQERPLREAAGGQPRRRPADAGRGQGQGRARRLRARHLPRRRHPDLPQADRRRLDRRAGRRDRLHDLPRPRELAPRPGVLLRGRRRPDVRHGPLLPDRAGQPDRPDRARHRLDAHHLPGAHHHQPAEVRQA